MRMVHVMLSKTMFVFVALLVGALLAGCLGPEPQELPFETIEHKAWPETGEHWANPNPGLVVVTTPEEVERLERFVTVEARRIVRTLDFETYFAAGVFWGWKSSGYRDFQINRVVRRGDEVAIYAQAGSHTGEQEVTSPYHLVRVQKVGKWNSDIHFTVHFERAVTQTHFIP